MPLWLTVTGASLGQCLIAAYGGFFGGGIGILMLALFAIIGLENVHAMNALRLLLTVCLNGVAVLTFVLARGVGWPQALVMAAGTIAGGYAGATLARRLDAGLVGRFVIVVGCVMTIYFSIRAFLLAG